MLRRIIIYMLTLLPSLSQAANLTATVGYDVETAGAVPGPYAATAEQSWATYDIDGDGPLAAARHRQAVVISHGHPAVEVLRVWDAPNARQLTTTIANAAVRDRITLRQVFYEGGPWLAATAYALGDKINVGGFPSQSYWWECTRAGTSGATMPAWPPAIRLLSGAKPLTDGQAHTLYGEVVDIGAGLVKLRLTDLHAYSAGAAVTITGTTNYDGNYTLPDQSAGDSSHLIIPHAFVAETCAWPQKITLSAGAAVDNGDGTVLLPVPGHGFVAGDAITISGSAAYSGTHTLPAQTLGDADHIVITAPYTAEVFYPGVIAYKAPAAADNGDGTVSLPAAGHGVSSGDAITISGSAAYSGTHTLPAQTLGDADHIVITAPYTAEVFNGGAVAQPRAQDPGPTGAEWALTTGSQLVTEGSPTGRLLIGDNGGGQAVRTGETYILRSAP